MNKKFDYSYRKILAECEFSSFSLYSSNTEYKENMRTKFFLEQKFKHEAKRSI